MTKPSVRLTIRGFICRDLTKTVYCIKEKGKSEYKPKNVSIKDPRRQLLNQKENGIFSEI